MSRVKEASGSLVGDLSSLPKKKAKVLLSRATKQLAEAGKKKALPKGARWATMRGRHIMISGKGKKAKMVWGAIPAGMVGKNPGELKGVGGVHAPQPTAGKAPAGPAQAPGQPLTLQQKAPVEKKHIDGARGDAQKLFSKAVTASKNLALKKRPTDDEGRRKFGVNAGRREGFKDAVGSSKKFGSLGNMRKDVTARVKYASDEVSKVKKVSKGNRLGVAQGKLEAAREVKKSLGGRIGKRDADMIGLRTGRKTRKLPTTSMARKGAGKETPAQFRQKVGAASRAITTPPSKAALKRRAKVRGQKLGK